MSIQKIDTKGKVINITADEFPEQIRVHKGNYTAVYTNAVEDTNISGSKVTELLELVDGAKACVELYPMECGEAQKEWKINWLKKANQLLNESHKPTECICNAKPEHMGDGRYGKWHGQDCPMFDGDHPEICRESTGGITK